MTPKISMAIMCLAISVNSVDAQRYVEIAAELESFSYKLGDDLRTGKNPIRYNYSLNCIVGANDWRIDSRREAASSFQCWFDGTNTYLHLGSAGSSSVHVKASRDGHPLGSLNLNLPWLAFCSGTYLKRENRLIPFPLTESRHTPDTLAYTDKTTVFEDDLGLPRSIAMFASDKLFDASVTNGVFRGKQDPTLWRRGSTGFKWDFPDGALRFHYTVTASTNFRGWNLPLQAEWTFNVHEDGKLFTRKGGSITITSISDSAKPKSVIRPGDPNQNIVDWRFFDPVSKVEAIIYYSTNSSIAPTNDPTLQRLFAEKIAKAAWRRTQDTR